MNWMDGSHTLLEAASPAYTNSTVRRAFIVWMHCGQRNSFKDVCNYYHHLETLEEKLPADRRASSRHHEFNMFSTPPPTSPYLQQTFPKLYTLNNTQHYIKKLNIIRNDTACKMDAFSELKFQNSVTKQEIFKTSDMIQKYCKSHMMTLKKFLVQFKDLARKCELNYTVQNVAFYIKRKMVEEELLMVENYAKSLNFLNLSEGSDVDDLKRLPKYAFEDWNNNKVDEDETLFESEEYHKHITILTKDNGELRRYWNDLAYNQHEMTTTCSRS